MGKKLSLKERMAFYEAMLEEEQYFGFDGVGTDYKRAARRTAAMQAANGQTYVFLSSGRIYKTA